MKICFGSTDTNGFLRIYPYHPPQEVTYAYAGTWISYCLNVWYNRLKKELSEFHFVDTWLTIREIEFLFGRALAAPAPADSALKGNLSVADRRRSFRE